jgi:acetyl-CoA carboxylase alpha subunit
MSSIESHTSSRESDQQAELAALRTRVAELERQLIEVEAWANRAVAQAQERVYWLDRWQIDLNAVMQRPGAAQFRAAVRVFRGAYRFVRRIRRGIKSA